ncbi:unnamed protein product [Rotaria socialis]
MASVPRRILLPIQGFEKMPLVSLIPDVEQMVWIAEQNCSECSNIIITLLYLLCMIRFMIMTEPTNLDKSSSQRLLTANINIDNFQSEKILNDRSDLPVNDNKISDQEELVIIDEVETEIILDSSNENRALISTIKLGISTESTTWFCEDCICMHEEEEQ